MSEARPRIVVAECLADHAVARLREAGEVTVLDACDESALMRTVVDADALVVRTRSAVTRTVIEAGAKLKVIGRAGVGLDNIDLEAAGSAGIPVVYTPYAGTEAVADLAVGMLIALTRRLGWGERMLRAGEFAAAREQACARELHDLTLGIVGMGRIGQAVARHCRDGFGLAVIYNDIREVGWLPFAANAVSKDELYRQADVVSLHVPLTPLTHRLIGKEVFDAFKPGAILINTARGSVVDSLALAEALGGGRLGGAGLDVFDPEPLPTDHPLLLAPNTLLTPHLGARTDRGLAGMSAVVEDVLRVLAGKPTHHAAGP